MIADHDPAVRDFLERMLAQAGYHVHEAANGREVLELIYRLGDRIALVVMDVDMPEMDGLRVLKSVTSFFPSTRVLMIEEEPGDAREQELLDAGADVFLAKPLDSFRLMEAVRAILPE
ncbi:MAG: response regulator [bacterium]